MGIGTILLLFVCVFLVLTALYLIGRLKQTQAKVERSQRRGEEWSTRIAELAAESDALTAALEQRTTERDDAQKALDEANEFRRAAAVEFDVLRGEVQRLIEQLHKLETKGDTEYAVLPVATTNGTAKRTRKKGGAQ